MGRSKQKVWSRKYKECVSCGTTERRHIARGLCTRCYEQEDTEYYRKTYPTFADLRKARKKLTKEYLVEEYVAKDKSLHDIARRCGCTKGWVRKKLVSYNIPLKSLQKIKFNENFFSSWSPEMTYVLGIVYTDGTLYPGAAKDPVRKTVARKPRLIISQKEPELLRKVLELMECNAKLYFRPQPLWLAQISSDKIYADLANLGLTPKKSLTIDFPIIPPEYVRHFIRGCWDGDGSVYEDRATGTICASFVSGSLKFIKGMLAELEKAGLPARTIHERKGKSTSYYFRFAGGRCDPLYHGSQCDQLYHYLYDGVPPDQYLERKYQLFKGSCWKVNETKTK